MSRLTLAGLAAALVVALAPAPAIVPDTAARAPESLSFRWCDYFPKWPGCPGR